MEYRERIREIALRIGMLGYNPSKSNEEMYMVDNV
jgi:hypothetical protein